MKRLLSKCENISGKYSSLYVSLGINLAPPLAAFCKKIHLQSWWMVPVVSRVQNIKTFGSKSCPEYTPVKNKATH